MKALVLGTLAMFAAGLLAIAVHGLQSAAVATPGLMWLPAGYDALTAALAMLVAAGVIAR